jgi:hypothetical protein
MILFLTLATTFAQATPVVLKHSFTKGLKSEYEVNAELDIEQRERGLNTFLPDTIQFKYTFLTNTLDVNHDIGTVRYSRPTVTEIGGATADSDPKTTVEKIGWLQLLQISPINEVIDDKDLTPKKKAPAKVTSLSRSVGAAVRRQDDLIGPFLDDLQRLSVFIGGPDSSLDFEPKFNFDAVKVGDTWQRTVSYQPQKLASKSGKDTMIVKRLDMTYTYKGLVESHGKQFQRIHAELNLNTDLGDFYNGFFQAKPENTGLKSIPTTLNMKMDFDLDPKTLQTVYGTLKSEGSFQIILTAFPDPVQEMKIHGSSEMHLVSNKIVAEPTAKK